MFSPIFPICIYGGWGLGTTLRRILNARGRLVFWGVLTHIKNKKIQALKSELFHI